MDCTKYYVFLFYLNPCIYPQLPIKTFPVTLELCNVQKVTKINTLLIKERCISCKKLKIKNVHVVFLSVLSLIMHFILVSTSF